MAHAGDSVCRPERLGDSEAVRAGKNHRDGFSQAHQMPDRYVERLCAVLRSHDGADRPSIEILNGGYVSPVRPGLLEFAEQGGFGAADGRQTKDEPEVAR